MEMGSGPADAQENIITTIIMCIIIIVGHKAKTDALNIWNVITYYYTAMYQKDP